jgi:hypothetical protein
MNKHSYSWSDGVLFSFVLKLNLKHLIPMLSSNSKSLDFEFKAFIITISKTKDIINKANIISNTTPLNY